MARLMLFSMSKSSIFPGVYARSNPAPLSGILQLSRNSGSTPGPTIPALPLKPNSVWIDVKAHKVKVSWSDLAKKIYDNLPDVGGKKPTVILSGSSVTVCSYHGSANAVSIYTTLAQDQPDTEPVVKRAQHAVLEYLVGETFVKIDYHQVIQVAYSSAKTQY